MRRKNNAQLPDQVIGKAIAAEAVCLIMIFIFTNSVIYCIISLAGAAISISGFLLLIRSTDRMLKKGKGKAMFFLLAQAKLLVIVGAFYAASRLAKNGAIFFIQGIAVIYLAIIIEGMVRVAGTFGHGT
jgi:hypothetical protein